MESRYDLGITRCAVSKYNENRSAHTLRHIFEVITRSDAPQTLVVETWGGYNKGYCKTFPSGSEAEAYLTRRIRRLCGGKEAYFRPVNHVKVSSKNEIEFYATQDFWDVASHDIDGTGLETLLDRLIRKTHLEYKQDVDAVSKLTFSTDPHKYNTEQSVSRFIASASKPVTPVMVAEAIRIRVHGQGDFDAEDQREAVKNIRTFMVTEPVGVGSTFRPDHIQQILDREAKFVSINDENVEEAPMLNKAKVKKQEQKYKNWGGWS